jgi:hypothetical protein
LSSLFFPAAHRTTSSEALRLLISAGSIAGTSFGTVGAGEFGMVRVTVTCRGAVAP